MTVLESAEAAGATPSGAAHVTHDLWTPIELTLLGAIWGSSFLFMRIAAADFGPLPLVEVRLVAGVAILLPFLWRARSRITRRHWLRFAVIGSLNSAIPFSLFAWGAERAPAGIGAIANIFALSSVLERRGMKVLTATTGREAVTLVESNPEIAIVLMDIMMPQMDGYQTIGVIRENPAFARLPIIALTAKAMKGDREKCLEAGASDYLAKPVNTDQLLLAIRMWLHR